MRWTIVVIVALALLVLFLGGQIASVLFSERIPKQLVNGAGAEGGSYFRIQQGIKQAIADRNPKIQVTVVETQGSRENLQRIKQGTLDFAFYQNSGSTTDDVALVANVYSESLLLIVSKASRIQGMLDLKGKVVSVGPEKSGTRDMVQEALERNEMTIQDFDARAYGFKEIVAGFRKGDLDAAFVVTGMFSPFFDELFQVGNFDILPIPYAKAIAAHNPSMFPKDIPQGYFRGGRHPIPSQDIQTISVHASLITRSDIPTYKVRYLCEVFFDHSFRLNMNLRELNETMAQQPGDFPLHPVAMDFYRRGEPTFSSYLKETLKELSWHMVLGIVAIIGLVMTKTQRAREAKRLYQERVSRFIEEAFRYQSLAIDEADPQKIVNYHKLLVMQVKDKATRAFMNKQLGAEEYYSSLIAACDSVEKTLLARLDILRARQESAH